jgi:NAD(P)H-flavin reductase/ferredoxin
MWKYIRYCMLSLIGAAAICAMCAGGTWMWLGFGLALTLALGGDAVFGDDLSEPGYAHTWLLDVQLYSNLPLLLMLTFAFAWQLSDWDVFGFGALIEAVTGYDAIAARATNTLSDYIGGGLGLGLFYGVAGTNVGHELTHRTWSKSAQIVGRWLLAFTSDASFAIEHVYGHHKNVATFADAATARRGEHAWGFVVRSTIGSYLGAWHIESERLARQGHSMWSWRNKMHRGNLMTLSYIAFFGWAAGWTGACAMIAVSLYGKCWLELVNYMEHYGMVRVPGAPVEPRHSWNCNRRISGYLLYNLTRHSHHHAMGEKPFWELRAYPDTPMMPHGYLTMILIAMVPPLWNRLVIPRVLAWDNHFASDAERPLIAQANARSNHAWFTQGLPEGMTLPEIASEPLPEAANTDSVEARAPSTMHTVETRILELFGRGAQTVGIEDTALQIQVDPGKTILSAALEQGLSFPHNCRVGGCAACKCKLVSGKVRELTDSSYILSADDLANDYILACQSVPRTPVVVALDDPSALTQGPGHPIYRTAARILKLEPMTHDILAMTLELDGPVTHTPGQYVELSVPGEIEEPRAYSFASATQSPDEFTRHITVHVRRVLGGAFTSWLHERARVGDELALAGPFGDFCMREQDVTTPIIAVAGGSGMAPLLSILRGASQSDRARDVVYYYGARTSRDLYAQAEVARIAASWTGSFTYVPVLSEPEREEWGGERGLVTEILERDLIRCVDPSQAELYMCGPPGMIDAAIEVAAAHGIARTSMYFDRFLNSSHLNAPMTHEQSA